MAEFINPYNFVPLTKQKKIYQKNEEEKFTGVIEYSVLTKTPLFIPNTSNDQAFHASKEYAGKNTGVAAKISSLIICFHRTRNMMIFILNRSFREVRSEECFAAVMRSYRNPACQQLMMKWF